MKRTKAVIGVGFGDEGKGLVTQKLCKDTENPIVVRFSGGQQAGHTAYQGGVRHVFSNFGSGTLVNVPTYWSRFCTFEPIGMVNEYESLVEKGFKPTIYIDEKSPVTTPYEIRLNSRHDESLGHGTCGLGVGLTWHRQETLLHDITAKDLKHPNILQIKLDILKEKYNIDVDLSDFWECVYAINQNPDIQIIDYGDYLLTQHNPIFESSQGLLLDKDIGFFPHVARTNTGSKNILEIVKPEDIEYYLVTRAYQTRHGNGPMTNHNYPHNILDNPEETNVDNTYQGEFRKSILDMDMVLYAIDSDPHIKKTFFNFVITCMDHIVDEYRFTYKGEMVYCDDKSDFLGKIYNILVSNGLSVGRFFISESQFSENITEVYPYMEGTEKAMRDEDNRQYQQRLEILSKIESKVTKEQYEDILTAIKESEYTFNFKITDKPKGAFQDDYDHIDGIWVNQTTNGGWTGDEFAGTVSIKIQDDEYLEFEYSM